MLVNITDQYKTQYNLLLNTKNLQLGRLMQNQQIGSLTGDFKINGNGIKPEVANSTFSGVIPDFTLNNYTYTNIKADGHIVNKVYEINASVRDPNLDAALSAEVEFLEFPI